MMSAVHCHMMVMMIKSCKHHDKLIRVTSMPSTRNTFAC